MVCTPGQKIASSFLEWAIMYRQICFDLNGYTLGLIGMASRGCEYGVDLLIVMCVLIRWEGPSPSSSHSITSGCSFG